MRTKQQNFKVKRQNMTPLQTIILDAPKKPHKATVIWLHGLGASGHDFVDFIPELNLPDELAIRFVFPHAPHRLITKFNRTAMRAWFDITELSQAGILDEHGIYQSQQLIDDLIARELEQLPSTQIFLAGFSQGGAMALHCGLRYTQKLGGILVLSGFLALANKLSTEKKSINQTTPILMLHGSHDSIVPIAWAKLSYDYIKNLRYNITWKSYAMDHTVCAQEARDIAAWIKSLLTTS